MRKYLLFWLTLAVFLSELALYLDVVYGFIIYCLLVAGMLVFLSNQDIRDNYGKLSSVVMIVPIARISDLFLNLDMLLKSLIFYSGILLMMANYLFAFEISHRYTKKRTL